MDTKKRLLEAREADQEVLEFMKRAEAIQHPFLYGVSGKGGWYRNYQQHLVEGEIEMGKVRGQTVGDASGAGSGMQVAATLEIFNAVIRGFTRYMDDSFVKKYTTDSVVFKVPLLEYQELVSDISSGEFPHTEKKIDYAVVDLSNPESEKGGKVTWTRALLEDVTFDVQAEMMEGLGHAIAKKVMAEIIKKLLSCTPANMPKGNTVTISDPITWAQFLDVVGAVDVGTNAADSDTGYNSFKTYGPADYCLVSPDVYWQLLNIIQLTNVLYEGSTDPIKAGTIKLALGTTIIKQGLIPPNTLVAVNSQKAIAMVTRRTLKIEPVLFPVWNEYGFIGSVRFGTTLLFEGAIQVGSV
jgi:hypothetical protein